jgi:glycosyltransferase involved in cell wall biosynthesis
MRVVVVQLQAFLDGGQAETCYRICEGWARDGHDVQIYTTVVWRADPVGILRPVVPRWLPAPIRGWLSRHLDRRLRAEAERRATAAVRTGDLLYVWPGASNTLLESARAKGALTAIEFINTHLGNVRRILDTELQRLDMGKSPYDDAGVLIENERLGLADFAFAPGPFVGPSIRAECPNLRAAVLETSYGSVYPEELPPRDFGHRSLRFLCVGTLCVRKGTHVLLEAWRSADLPHRLDFAGDTEPEFEPLFARLDGERVGRLGYVEDMGKLYDDVDVFVFPSLEEGGPQVAYEAAAHGLPMIVTPMGGGRIANPETAIVVPHGDVEALINALRLLSSEPTRRKQLSEAARSAAQSYDWQHVSRQRMAAIEDAIADSFSASRDPVSK